MGDKVKKYYEGGVCPDCGEEIPDDYENGQACDNCGHAFFVPGPDDDSLDPDTYWYHEG